MKDMKKMTKLLIPLSLMTMACGFADSIIADRCCPPVQSCPTNCCKPCCVPQPRKCIDCECYNPQFYDLQCAWGAFVTVDFLYWYARETNLEFGYNQRFFNQDNFSANETQFSYGYATQHHYIKTDWSPGVRVGLGWNSDCDGWDLFLNWTYFHNHAKSSTSDPQFFNADRNFGTANETYLIQPWMNADNIHANGFDDFTRNGPVNVPRSIGKWSLIFNQVDLELGIKYWIRKCVAIRPYIGLRGAWTHTRLGVIANWQDPRTLTVEAAGTFIRGPQTNKNSNLFINKSWGVGFLGGVQPEFIIGNWCGCGNFSIYGNFEGALIWGKYRGRNKTTFLDSTSITIRDEGRDETRAVNRFANPVERDNFSRMKCILDLGLGLRWEEHWCCDRYSTSIDLGWEHHYWFNFGLYHRPGASETDFASFTPRQASFPLTTDNFVTDLGFGGLVIRARFDF